MKPFKTSIAVCEYNPFHTGHKLHLDAMRTTNPDAVAVIMSGNFCQRGEAAVADKFTRARHAVLSGADVVFELPAVFSVAPAEVFATGAIKLIDSLPGKKTLYFGAESGTKDDYMEIAKLLNTENKEFKAALAKNLAGGVPYAAAKVAAYQEVYPEVDFSLLKNPNSVLGVEYVRALLRLHSSTDIAPLLRNTDYNGLSLDGKYCSAAAIRAAIEDGKKKKVRDFVPTYVYDDLPDVLPAFDDILIFKALESSPSEIAKITDCTEGLENRIKSSAPLAKSFKGLIDMLETRRYTRARLRRIITANMLGITHEFTKACLKSNLYLKVLAVANDKLNLLSEFSKCRNRLITRKSDEDLLSGIKKQCFLKDLYANDIYCLKTKEKINGHKMEIVKRG